MKKRALTIAGSDSGGGAGIQADLKTFGAIGVHGMSAITSVTAQNTVGVQEVYHLPPEFISQQIDSCLNDIGVDIVKTGMLATSAVIDVVMEKLAEHQLQTVVDPVMVSASGDRLLEEKAVDKMKQLLSKAYIATPNIPEAEALTGLSIENLDQMKEAAQIVFNMGARNVVVKGGHQSGKKAADVFYNDEGFSILEKPRVETKNDHGTGCTFAAAAAAYTALGASPLEAIKDAKGFVFKSLKRSLSVGSGRGPVNHLASLEIESKKLAVLKTLEDALDKLRESDVNFGPLTPEVSTNFAYALPEASSIEEVAGFSGRIHWINDRLRTLNPPRFGGSNHVARIILTAMEYCSQIRSCMNIKYSEENLEKIESTGLVTATFNREEEPVDADTMNWGPSQAIMSSERVPDTIYDTGAVGKEPMIRITGENPFRIVDKLINSFA